MSKARQLPSGSWNVQVYDGKDPSGKKLFTSFTAPTKAEAEFLAAEYKTGRAKKKAPLPPLTVGDAVQKYINLSEPVLSPSTVRGYRIIRDQAFPGLMPVMLSDLSPELVQLAINQETRRRSSQRGTVISPKTVRSEWALVSSALKARGLSFSPKLPAYQKAVKAYPDPAAVMAAIIGSDVELPCLLALWLSLTMSEIRGLRCSSVRDGFLYVDQVAISVGASEVVKPTGKTATRLRRLAVPPYLMGLITSSTTMQNYAQMGADGPLVPQTRNWIYKHWRKATEAAGLSMTFHDLRHMNASVMLLLGVPEKYAMERGGWSTPHVMKSVYQHTFDAERVRVDARIDAYFEDLLHAVCTDV